MSIPDREELLAGIEQWQATGYGINPSQPALRHFPENSSCPCWKCAGAPVVVTSMPPEMRAGQRKTEQTQAGQRRFPS